MGIRRLLSGALAAGLILTAGVARADCRDDRVTLRGDWGQARFGVEVADDPAERARGLMHRESLPASRGMLFVYDRPQRMSFWMRNTLIPLDIIFLDSSGRVIRVHENARPRDETPIPSGGIARYVLEINGGFARRLGIDVGTELRHTAIPADAAAWPCTP